MSSWSSYSIGSPSSQTKQQNNNHKSIIELSTLHWDEPKVHY